MEHKHVLVEINSSIFAVVEDIKNHLETNLLIRASEQDIIENAIVAFRLVLK